MCLMNIEQHVTDEAPNHRAVARPLARAIDREGPAVGVAFVGDPELCFEEVAYFLESSCMDQADIAVESVAAAKQPCHPRDDAVGVRDQTQAWRL
jgi:hypothetical protein